jgi:cobalt-zinc-cadmium efflux system membrane fusion protein
MRMERKERATPGRARWWKRAAVLTLIGVLGCKNDQKTASAPAPMVDKEKITIPADAPQKESISAEPVDYRKTTVTHLTGRLVWNDETTVRIFSPVAGRVSEIEVALGQTVSAGTSLAKINSPDFGQALSDARTSAANMRAAEKAFTRAKELFEHGAAAQKDVESAEATYVSAVSERDRAQARLALYGGSDKGTNDLYLLQTPLAGVVVDKTINPGQEVRPDQMLANAPQLFAPLFVVSDPTKLWLQLDVTELDLSSLKPGQKLKIHSRAFPDKIFDGRLGSVGSSLDPNTRTVKVRADVDNPDNLLKAEMYVTVDVTNEVPADSQAGVDVSSKAVFLKDNQHYVFVEDAPGEYERKLVKLGAENDGKVLVTEGIRAGQRVVTQGCLLLQALLDSAEKS